MFEAMAGKESGTDYPAHVAIMTADAFADTRPLQAHAIAGEIVEKPDYHSWKLAGKVAIAGALDWLDGKFARWGARRLGIETTPEGARKDQENDKKWTYTMLGALATRAFMDGDTEYGTFLMANQTIIRTRDQTVNQKRQQAEKLNIDAKAQTAGKVKTGLQNLTFTVMTSPLAKTRWGKRAVYALQSVSTGLSLYSGFSLNRNLKRDMKTDERFKDLAKRTAR